MPPARLGTTLCTRSASIRVSSSLSTTRWIRIHSCRGARQLWSSTLTAHLQRAKCYSYHYSTAAHAEDYSQDNGENAKIETSSQSNSDTPQQTPSQPSANHAASPCPFIFENGFALHAKRKHNPRPFPPPFMSAPSGSFSDPLSTHNPHRSHSDASEGDESEISPATARLLRRKPTDGKGRVLLGLTNGDDAVVLNQRFVAANDGVGAWATREKGNAALWARLVVHFWAVATQKEYFGDKTFAPENEDSGKEKDDNCPMSNNPHPNPIEYLQSAYESTVSATKSPEIFGTTTASGALLSYTSYISDEIEDAGQITTRPILYVTQLGDSQIMVVRPKDREIIYRTAEQWHWFDCPRQLGTNSPDTPTNNAVIDRVENLEEGDVVLAMSDGVGDNLWEHEIMACVVDALHKFETTQTNEEKEALEVGQDTDGLGREMADSNEMGTTDEMMFVARELVRAARVIAEDPFAESPYMEKAIDEGLSIDGGKRDDISVVAAKCIRIGKIKS